MKEKEKDVYDDGKHHHRRELLIELFSIDQLGLLGSQKAQFAKKIAH